MGNILELQKIEKSFNQTKVLKGINLSVKEGEFMTFLGASGCGKTTTLRIIAGLEQPDQGAVILEGQEVTKLEPNKRNVNTVFQNYALFPHMNVFDNIAYSLKLRKVPKDEIQKQVLEALEMVQLSGFEKRMPSEMSGGQKQRVAIARAIINRPKILLLDEPLGALDLQLRRQMQIELKRLQQKLGITFIYITHDQEEAINLSDRIVVMKNGEFEQIGTPTEIYDYPKTSYVATFVGSANILKGQVTAKKENYIEVDICDSYIEVENSNEHIAIGDQVTLAIRSEVIDICEGENSRGPIVLVREKQFVGGMLRIVTELSDGTELVISRHGINFDVKIGDKIQLCWKRSKCVVVDMEDK